MKYIEKHLGNEPFTLKEYRSTPNATYKGYTDSYKEEDLNRQDLSYKKETGQAPKPLKMALCKEQGYICCYCMRRIDEERVTVEHYITQERHPDSPYSEQIHKDNQLIYSNLLASCNTGERNCSGIRGNSPLIINPLSILIEQQISFQKDGKIISSSPQIAKDIDILMLNSKETAFQLLENRAVILEKVRSSLPKSSKSWTKAQLQAELKKWENPDKQGRYRPFCQIAIAYLQSKLKK